MQTIRINDGLFEALGPEEARSLAAAMREHGLVSGDVEITGDASVPVPDMSTTVFGMDFSEAMLHSVESTDVTKEFKIKLPKIKIPSFPCKLACDAAAAAATAAIGGLSGPALAAALAAIAVAREECRRRC